MTCPSILCGCPQIIFLACVASLASARPGQDSDGRLKIGNVSNDLSSNGCALQLPSQYRRREGKFVFVSDFENHGLVNVNGTDVRLELISPAARDEDHKPAIGEHSTFVYAGNGLEVRVDYSPGTSANRSKSGELTYYDAILTVTRGKASKRVAARAVCAATSR
ncbi:MAG: hypothetical protein JOZ62_21910 [Acidobacteriaceae bacterium]|nr:hypothetical protein [Acidobacteriaceae bacterium]